MAVLAEQSFIFLGLSYYSVAGHNFASVITRRKFFGSITQNLVNLICVNSRVSLNVMVFKDTILYQMRLVTVACNTAEKLLSSPIAFYTCQEMPNIRSRGNR